MINWRLDALHSLRDSIDDLALCGPLYTSLREHLHAQLHPNSPSSTPQSPLSEIITASHANLAVTSLFRWRRLHTDASILSALQFSPLDAVAKLDTAIIVSGAAGEGRLDLILDIIQHIQSESLRQATYAHLVPRSIPPISPSKPEVDIPSLATPPSFTVFQSHQHQAPFVLRGFARAWPALNEHPWASIDYLRSVAGPGRVVPVEIGCDYRMDDWSQKLIAWDEFLDSLDTEDAVHPMYLAQHSLFMQLPSLRADIDVPDYVYAAVPRPSECPPPQNDEQLVINAWLGPRGTVSPAHTDPYFNFYVQVAGWKTVWIAPPECAAGLQATGNTSGVDVFATDLDATFDGMSMATILGPGDMLYMPPKWWHAMRSESRSFSVSMWF
ncbi:leucine-rich repeat-containing protein SOG2 [Favolaschia claudopus]|uniref:Leucine-rich repeat-containing protein SOG2 n=1 Tax=Favolaschia claudopus TaxID=2862362 RepID=A0AAW0CAF4_9AGAR